MLATRPWTSQAKVTCTARGARRLTIPVNMRWLLMAAIAARAAWPADRSRGQLPTSVRWCPQLAISWSPRCHRRRLVANTCYNEGIFRKANLLVSVCC